MLNDILKIIQTLKDFKAEVLFYVACAVFWFVGAFEIGQNSVSVRGNPSPVPFALGLLFLILGLLFSFGFNPQRTSKQKRIVFYAPTIKENPFYHELLDQVVEIATKKQIEIVIRKGLTTTNHYHHVDDYLDLLREFNDRDYKNTAIIMIPPSPQAYERIFELAPNLKVNLITLDMEVTPLCLEKFSKCDFLKKVILLDNEHGCKLAADEIISYCRSQCANDINVIICEGEFHDRGRHFREHLSKEGEKANININFLDRAENRSFSKATAEAFNHVTRMVNLNKDCIVDKPTIVFCANDNMAIGARVAASNLSRVFNTATIKIVSFDASDVIRRLIELEDRYVCWSVDQKFYKYAEEAVRFSEMVLNGVEVEKTITYITPGIYKK